MRKRIALITGVSGQDGAYLAQSLLEKGYVVHGVLRWDSYVDSRVPVDRLHSLGIVEQLNLHYADLCDAQSMTSLIKKVEPDEIYNLAAISQVGVSFEVPAAVLDVNTKGVLAILEAMRLLDLNHVRFYQASSSEMYGNAPAPQTEDTPMQPCSPYGVSKLAAYWMVRTYRESYGLFASNGILFNHESPLRSDEFVTQKIVKAVCAYESDGTGVLALGNLDAMRDWGHSRDYVDGMWRILNHNQADDFVLSTGIACSVREFVDQAFSYIGVQLAWRGQAGDEVAVHKKSGKVVVCVDPSLYRPNEVHYLLGDSSKAQRVLNWRSKYDLDSLIADMVHEERRLIHQEKALSCSKAS